jgi:hypothetical protein
MELRGFLLVTLKRGGQMRTKLIIMISFFLPLFSISAKEWSVKSTGDEYSLIHSNYEAIELELEGPTTPKMIEAKKHKLFDIVVVDHGEVGTSCLVRIHKAYIFNKASAKFIGVYPYRIIAVDSRIKKCKVKPVLWETFKNYISIHDKNTDKKFKITP